MLKKKTEVLYVMGDLVLWVEKEFLSDFSWSSAEWQEKVSGLLILDGIYQDNRDLKIEVWPSYLKRFAVSGFMLSVCPYLGTNIRGW